MLDLPNALLMQRTIAQQIRAQGGHYFMVVKANQPDSILQPGAYKQSGRTG